MVAWGSRAAQRLRRVDRRCPWGLDTAVVVCAFLVLCVPDLVGHPGGPDEIRIDFTHLPLAGTLALQAGLVLPLLYRRRNPTVAFTAILAVFLLQWSLGVWLRADAALLVALYSLVLHGRLRHLPWACAGMAGALGLVAWRFAGAVSTPDALFFLCSTAVAAIALGFAVRIRRAQLAGLRERAARLEIERDQRSRLAAITERARVAREMHDIVGHNLSVIITLADGGAYAVEAAPEQGKQALVLIGDTGRTALGELRRMLGALRERTDSLQLAPQPGVSDLEELFSRIRAAGPHVEYRFNGDPGALDRGLQLMAYRIVQEALTNTLKHAGPHAQAQVSVSVEPGQLRIRVEDSGPPGGAGRLRPPQAEGHGLAGMTERAALYGGTLNAGPGPGTGWTVEAVLDLTPLPEPSGTTT
ncbi:sensor histidine kinase [Streptomyces sp. NBC_01465]|nr:sensor histidine kinase [Streptomyces sp. NBC_01465]